MNGVGATAGASATTAAVAGLQGGADPQALLPGAGADPDVGDALTQLLKMSSELTTAESAAAKSSASSADLLRRDATAKRAEALNQALDAAKKAAEEKSHGGFFSFVSDHLGVAGLVGVAAVVLAGPLGATALELDSAHIAATGLGLAATDFASHTVLPKDSTNALDGAAMLAGPLAFAVEQLVSKLDPGSVREAADKLGSVKDEDVAVAKKIALSVLMAELSIAAAIGSGGTSTAGVVALTGLGISTATQALQQTGALQKIVGDKAAAYVAMGGAVAGAALTFGGSVAGLVNAAHATSLANVLSGAKAVAQGGYDVNVGIRDLRAAGYQHDADLAQIQAKAQKHVLEFVERFVDDVIEDMKAIKDSSQRAASSLQESLQIKDKTLLLAGSMKV